MHNQNDIRFRQIKSIDKTSKAKQKESCISKMNLVGDSSKDFSTVNENPEKHNLFIEDNYHEFLQHASKNIKEEPLSSSFQISNLTHEYWNTSKFIDKESPTERFTIKNIVSDKKESEFLSSNHEGGQKIGKAINNLSKYTSLVRTPEPRKYYHSQNYNPISETKANKKEANSLDKKISNGLKKNMLKSRIEKKKKLLQKEENKKNDLHNDPEILSEIVRIETELERLGIKKPIKKSKAKIKKRRKIKGFSKFDETLVSTLVKSYRRERLFANKSSRYDFARKKNLIQKFEPNYDKEENKDEDKNPVLTVVNLINEFATKIINN
jgi:hypothetical protein